MKNKLSKKQIKLFSWIGLGTLATIGITTAIVLGVKTSQENDKKIKEKQKNEKLNSLSSDFNQELNVFNTNITDLIAKNQELYKKSNSEKTII